MLAHLQGVESKLSSLGYTVHRFTAPAITAQYVVLSAPGWGADPERPVGGLSSAFEAEVRVTAVAETVDGVSIMLGRIRALLSPARAPVALTVTGRVAAIRFARSEFIDVDRTVTVPGTNRSPAFGVDTYTLTSEPA